MGPDRLVAQFESLGDSCEFGLVQRQAGAEPLGLLRFAGFTGPADRRLEELIAALDRGFEGLGEPDTVNVSMQGPADHREYIVRESAYGLMYHTFLGPTDIDQARLHTNESIRLRFLRRKLFADLVTADKIFVWKSNFPTELARVQHLLAALRRHGPARLLWVRAVDTVPGATAEQIGKVESLADGLLSGVVDRFAPYDRMADISHNAWLAVCGAALRATRPADEPDSAPREVSVASLRDLIARTGTDPSVGGLRGATSLAAAGSYARPAPMLLETTHLDPTLMDACRSSYGSGRQVYDDTLKVVLEQAMVTTHGAVITQDGYLLRDSCWEFIEAGLVPHGLTPLGPGHYQLSATPRRIVSDAALLLKRPWWRSYRHWLVETAALLAFAATRLDVGKLQLVVGKENDEGLRRTMRELLGMLAPGAAVLEHPDDELWQFADLHYITPIHVPPACKQPDALATLRSSALAQVGDRPAGAPKRRLYVAAGVTELPHLENEIDVIAVCIAHGCDVVRPDLLPIAERIAMFRDAEMIVGVKTPQFANIVFSAPPAVAVALSPGDWPDPFHWDIAAQNGLHYVEIFGEVTDRQRGPSQNPFRIDPARLNQILTELPARHEATGAAPFAMPPEAAAIAFEAFMPIVTFPEHKGQDYLQVLNQLHQTLRPRAYLELGTQFGDALALASCPSVAVDPYLLVREPVLRSKDSLFLFRMTSDAFFRRHDPARYLDGPIGMALLDGPMLHFDVILRDFIRTERHCTRQSVILIHDAVPLDVYMARRDRLDDFRGCRTSHPGWWTGDVWKIIGVLRAWRPDLTIDVFDATPTGLVMVRNLDPGSRVLHDQYDRIVREVLAWPDEDAAFASFRADLDLQATAALGPILAGLGSING
jgi:hypothetical protein